MLRPLRSWQVVLSLLVVVVCAWGLPGGCQAPDGRAEVSAAGGAVATEAGSTSGGTRAAAPVAVGGASADARVAPKASSVSKGRSDVDRLVELARTDNQAMEFVRTITRDHPKRLTGSRGYDRAAAWAVEQFRAMGLEARLETWGEFPVAFDRGVQSGRIVAPTEEALTFVTAAWTAGTKGPARGRAVLEPRTEEELAALDPKSAFAGAWIVRTETKEGAKFKKKLREAYDAHGILGVVRSGNKNGLLGMGGNHRVDPAALPTAVEIKLLASQYDALVARLEKGEALELEFDVQNVFTPGPVPCTNVVAEIVGSRFPDEYVIVQGHFDAWDGAEGAQDNATGTATTMEAARLVAKLGVRPLRTIRFVLYSGEEQGLFGSEGYVRDHKDELERVSVVLTHDAGGTFLQGIDATYAMMEDVRAVCGVLEDLDPRFPFTIHEVDGLENSGDSDHAPFIQAGVPSFFWHQSEKDYEFVHHTQHDVFSQIDPDQVRHSALVVAVSAFGFANLEHKLDRTDTKTLPRRRVGASFESGMVVQRVVEDGRAAKAGWQVGDRLMAVDGEPVANQADL